MSILNQYFDKIYVLYINDAELIRIKEKLNKMNIHADLFKGVNGYLEKDIYNEYKNKNNDSNILNCGSFGHISSFINIINDAIQNSYKKILILEPDIYFCTEFNERCTNYFKNIHDFKLLYFGASQNMIYKESTWQYIDNNYHSELANGFYYAYNTLGTFAIGIDQSIFTDLVQLLEPKKNPTDVYILELQKKYVSSCFVLYPNIICCDVSQSKTTFKKNQIEAINGLRWTLRYDFSDLYIFKTEVAEWYEFELVINSAYDNYKISIMDDNNNTVMPDITKKVYSHHLFDKYNKDKSERIFIYVKTNSSTTKLLINYLFLDNYSIKKLNKSIVITKIPLDVLRKYKHLDIGKYYYTNLYL